MGTRGQTAITKKTPFELLYGHKVRLNLSIPKYDELDKETYANYDDYVFQFLKKLEILRNKAFKKQYQQHKKIEKKLNENRMEFSFKLGQWVSKRTFKVGNQAKLAFKYQGPYEIIKIYPNGVTFQIQEVKSGDTSKIHGKHLANYEKTHESPPTNEAKRPTSESNYNQEESEIALDEEKIVTVLDRCIFNRAALKEVQELYASYIKDTKTNARPKSEEK